MHRAHRRANHVFAWDEQTAGRRLHYLIAGMDGLVGGLGGFDSNFLRGEDCFAVMQAAAVDAEETTVHRLVLRAHHALWTPRPDHVLCRRHR